jgi:glycosyltransferase involved in cell wall biosynthesis
MQRRGVANPVVSVVVPVYNGARFLAAALQSILEQGHQPLEVIVVDDGSSDASAEIARSFRGVRYHHQHNQGVGAAWNAGVAASAGQLIAFLAQDDLWARNKLAVQVAYMKGHSSAQYCIAHARYFLEPGCALPKGFRRRDLERDHVARIVETMVVRRAALDAVGPFDASVLPADVDWFARAKDAGLPMAILPDILLYRRIHDQNLTYHLPARGQEDLLKVIARSIRRQHGAGNKEDIRSDPR